MPAWATQDPDSTNKQSNKQASSHLPHNGSTSKALAAEPDDLSSIPGTHVVEGEN